MKKITFLTLLFLVSYGFSQSIPITFDAGITVGAKVDGVVTPSEANWFSDSGLTSVAIEDLTSDTPDHGNAGKIVSSVSGQPWQNAQILLQDNYIDLTTNKVITLDVYSENPQDFLLKMEQSKNGGANTEKSFSHGGTGWESISVDFTTPNSGQPVPNDQYKLFVIFPCYSVGFATAPFDSVTYIDNFSGSVGDALTEEPTPTSGATAPTADAAEVYGLFGDTYTQNTPAAFSQVWGDGVVSDFDTGNGIVKKYDALNFQAINLASTVDLTNYTHIHVDVWTPNANAFGLKLQDFGADDVDEYPNVDDSESELASSTTQTSQTWVGHDFAIADFTGLTGISNLGQIQVLLGALANGTQGTVYIDNLYLYSEQTPSGNSVTVETSQSWNGYINAFNVSDDAYAFGFSYGAADLRATSTATSMTLEPNVAIWTAEASNTAWFDNSSGTQTPVKYIEASSFIENNALAGSDLTFSGTVTSNDLDPAYTVVAFIKALDPNNGYATVVNMTASLTGATGDFTVSATADQLLTGYIIQYGFTMTGLPADPADTTLGSLVVGEVSSPSGPSTSAPTPPARDAADVVSLYSDVYTNSTNWGEINVFGGSLEDVIVDEDNTYRLTSGFQYNYYASNSSEDLSAMTHMHVDFYVDGDVTAGQVLGVQLLGEELDATPGADENNYYQEAFQANTWVSVDVPLANFVNVGTVDPPLYEIVKLIQVNLQGPAGSTFAPVYLDNFYFYREASAGLNDNILSSVKMFPNPAQDSLKFYVNSNENLEVEIFDMLGKSVVRINDVQNEVNISDLNSGLYFVQITLGTQQTTKKLIVK